MGGAKFDELPILAWAPQGTLHLRGLLAGFEGFPQQQDKDGKAKPSDCHNCAFDHGSMCTVTQGRADTCMYTVARKCNSTGKCASFRIVVYMDDTALAVPRTTDNRQLFHDFCAHVNSKFKFQADDDGNRRGKPVDVFLGVEYTRDELKSALSQRQPHKIRELLELTGTTNTLPRAVPGALHSVITLADSPPDGPAGDAERAAMAKVPYRSAVMSALWIARSTRPDIQHQVSALTRVMHKPGLKHWQQALQDICRYLKYTADESLAYTRNDIEAAGMQMWFFVDANHLPKYGGVHTNMLSTGGWLCMMNGCCIAWKSRRQPLFADFTCVAEYMAAADAA